MLLELIDTLIAFLTIIALLSILVTALSQATQSLLRLRGRNLQRGLEVLLRQAMSATQKPGKGKPVGLMVVHGVGKQEPGDTLRTVLLGLRRAYPEARFETDGDVAVMTLNKRQVRLYEVHWAPVLKGEKIHGSFSLYRLHQLIWFPKLNHSYRDDHRTYYPYAVVRRWTRILVPVSMIITAIHLVFTIVLFIPTSIARKQKEPHGKVRRGITLTGRPGARATFIDDWLAERLGDVFNYLDAQMKVPSSPVPHAPKEINKIFCRTLKRVSSECSEVQILAHSMGSLVTYHALGRYRHRTEKFLAPDCDNPGDPRPPLKQIYTIGSPLEKILFFWPKAIDSRRKWTDVEWINFRNRLDPISGKLESKVLGAATNHTISGAGGLLTAHTGYRKHPKFLKEFGSRLTGTVPAMSPGLFSRSLRRVLDYAESGGVYLLVAALASLGAYALYRIGKSIRFAMDVPDKPFSALVEMSFSDGFLTLFPYMLGTALVVVIIIFAPMRAKKKSEDVHREYWR